MAQSDNAHGLDPELPILMATVEKVVQWARVLPVPNFPALPTPC